MLNCYDHDIGHCGSIYTKESAKATNHKRGLFFFPEPVYQASPSQLDSRYVVRYVQSTWNVHGGSAWLSGFQTKTRNALAMNPREETGAKLDFNGILIKDEV